KAVTNWKVCGRGDGLCWLALEPVTGRTHQLRVHTSAMGWPIVGDNIYGNGPRFGEPILHLHSREIVVPISKNKEPVRVVAPAPEHMRERLRKGGWNGEGRLRLLPSLLPLWEKVDRRREAAASRMRGLSPRREPLIRRFAPPSPTRGEGRLTPSAARHRDS